MNIFVHLSKGFAYSLLVSSLFSLFGIVFFVGFTNGYKEGIFESENQYNKNLPMEINKVLGVNVEEKTEINNDISPTLIPMRDDLSDIVVNNNATNSNETDLWQVVNTKRVQNGVSSLEIRDNLCTIAMVRLEELVSLGTLDGHAGFSSLVQKRPDLKPVFESYAGVSEFLQFGSVNADETVSLWQNSPEHNKLLASSSYVWGCVRTQGVISVAITAH